MTDKIYIVQYDDNDLFFIGAFTSVNSIIRYLTKDDYYELKKIISFDDNFIFATALNYSEEIPEDYYEISFELEYPETENYDGYSEYFSIYVTELAIKGD